MNVEISDQTAKQIEAVLAQQRLRGAELASSINRIVERAAADEELLLSLLCDEPADEEESGATVRKDAWKLPFEEWRKEWRAFADRQTTQNPIFDHSRESIYSEP